MILSAACKRQTQSNQIVYAEVFEVFEVLVYVEQLELQQKILVY